MFHSTSRQMLRGNLNVTSFIESQTIYLLNFYMKSLTLSCLICALNVYFSLKLLRKEKNAQGC